MPSLSAMRKKREPKETVAVPKYATETTTDNPNVSSTMRSIAIGRAYRSFKTQMLDDGLPDPEFYFDRKGKAARVMYGRSDLHPNRVVSSSTMLEHLNETVFKRVFGQPLRREVARAILDGISNEYLEAIDSGLRVKQPNLVTFEKVTRSPRKARNPRTGEAVYLPTRVTISAKPSGAAVDFVAHANG